MRGRIRHADYTDQPGSRHPGRGRGDLTDGDDFLKGLNLEKLITLLLLLAGCLVVMKLVLRLTDRAFLRLELERSLHTFIHAAAGYFVDDYPVYRSGLRGSAHD